ncbi:hypothetical protein HK405_003002 [Cladochytrium tenue]|nr:hypothetical protein HK405_003002 [Cladochytrium tenue]
MSVTPNNSEGGADGVAAAAIATGATTVETTASPHGVDALSINAAAAATWSAASAADRIVGAADAFEDSLYVLPADADEKTRLHMQV